ncbi:MULTISPECIES: hypothetical protein [unclassified Micromonospora]|uniref:hypothetical protein n=1 Tax=unclassified Micromonospora TaxID=2617518 RepID=UPI00363FBD35
MAPPGAAQDAPEDPAAPTADARPDLGRRLALLVLGPAALVLSAQALAPIAVRSQFDSPFHGPSLTVPVFAGLAALLLVLLFGSGRAVDRLRRDLLAEPTSSTRP